jgi:hypothetical protein
MEFLETLETHFVFPRQYYYGISGRLPWNFWRFEFLEMIHEQI